MRQNALFRRFAPYESRLPCQRRRKATVANARTVCGHFASTPAALRRCVAEFAATCSLSRKPSASKPAAPSLLGKILPFGLLFVPAGLSPPSLIFPAQEGGLRRFLFTHSAKRYSVALRAPYALFIANCHDMGGWRRFCTRGANAAFLRGVRVAFGYERVAAWSLCGS